MTGTMYMVNTAACRSPSPPAQGKLRIWRNTGLRPGCRARPRAGAEHRRLRVGRGHRQRLPAGRPDRHVDHDRPVPSTCRTSAPSAPGTTTHHITLYRAASGALVFGAGTIQWAWGLDRTTTAPARRADPRMQQAQVNLFADMGAQPSTLMAGLVGRDPAPTPRRRP